MNCHNCGDPIKNPRDKQKFCSGRCRAAWHRENAKGSAPGTVKGLRALAKGGWSVTIHLPDQPGVKPGDRVAISTSADIGEAA